jgi:hypothetical protein
VTSNLAGTGTQPVLLVFTPQSLDFASVTVGTVSGLQTIQVQNQGAPTGPLTGR